VTARRIWTALQRLSPERRERALLAYTSWILSIPPNEIREMFLSEFESSTLLLSEAGDETLVS
jgi:hypothetical protein